MNQDAELAALSSQASKFFKSYRFETIILLCFAPLVYLHFRNLWRYDHYQYFPLILLAFPYLVWNCRGTGPMRWTSPLWERGFAVTSLVLLAIATFFWSPNLAMLGAVFAVGSLLLTLRRGGKISQFLPLWFVLWFLVRLPGNLDITLIFSLQAWTSQAASLLLDALRIDHALLGNVIWAGPQSYFVEEACSGINSLFSLTALTAVALILNRRPPIHAILLLVAAVFWACVVNIIRVATLVLFNERWHIDLLEGTPHTLFGLILFLLAVAMLICTDQFLMMFHESEHVVELGRPQHPSTPANSPHNNIAADTNDSESSSPPRLREHRFAAILSPIFALLLLSQLYSCIAGTGRIASRNLQPSEIAFAATDLPTDLDGWTQTAFEVQTRDVVNYLGERSAVWTYQRDGNEVYVSVDYPFWHWHELIQCYQAQGQTLASREVLASDDELPAVVLAELTNISGQSSLLAFSLFRQSGIAMQPPPEASGFTAYAFTRIDNNLDTFFNRNEPTYQVQVLAPISNPTNAIAEDAILALHREVTQRIRSLVPIKAGGD
ncbi:Transmembrane exosortase (Exosortase_EpsH) [Rosistilla ulvae]|uniref:Transmembrane exosortase (Exosortase_EpsH) n=1 Tax=Rosistilla ulvae TaxID=1930277 RepID=A0A517LVB4_9BACT|nr:exosortase U [Rosistilla ulvae]QDS86561.1 Transmembrane exosortase (Exosortase_EpsH) [Rosistilla ulvae]